MDAQDRPHFLLVSSYGHNQAVIQTRKHEFKAIKTVSVTSEYPQDGGSVCFCYDYLFASLQDCVVCCILRVIRCIMSNAYHAERKYPQNGGHRKKAEGLYMIHK